MNIAENIKSLIPYKPGKPISETQREYGLSEVVKLASNENPLGPSSKVLDAVAQAAKELHRYPDASCFELNKAVIKYFKNQNIELNQNQLVFGNGSNELIDLIICCFCGRDDKILIPENSFMAYSICAQAAGIAVTQVPLVLGLKVDLNSIYEAWRGSPEKYKVIFLPNPNNPTGQVISKEEVDMFLEKMGAQSETMVIFDDAYFEFVRDKKYANSLDYLSGGMNEQFPGRDFNPLD
jgi:histidinol-phosphate aminotransferase